jgi:hypothetical protein
LYQGNENRSTLGLVQNFHVCISRANKTKNIAVTQSTLKKYE